MEPRYFNDDDYEHQESTRRRLNTEQIEILLEHFAMNPRPNSEEREELSRRTKLTQRAVQVWFQNRRAKLKKEAGDSNLFSPPSSYTSPKSDNNQEDGNENDNGLFTDLLKPARSFRELCLPSNENFNINISKKRQPSRRQQPPPPPPPRQILSYNEPSIIRPEPIVKKEVIRDYWKHHRIKMGMETATKTVNEERTARTDNNYVHENTLDIKNNYFSQEPSVMSENNRMKKMSKNQKSTSIHIRQPTSIENIRPVEDMPDLMKNSIESTSLTTDDCDYEEDLVEMRPILDNFVCTNTNDNNNDFISLLFDSCFSTSTSTPNHTNIDYIPQLDYFPTDDSNFFITSTTAAAYADDEKMSTFDSNFSIHSQHTPGPPDLFSMLSENFVMF